MPRYLIEGSCDGGLFAEAIDAEDDAAAERAAIERLQEAWGESGDDLDDLGDSASVRRFELSDYAEENASEMLQLIAQISRMTLYRDTDGTVDLGNDQAMDGLILRSRAIMAKMEPEA